MSSPFATSSAIRRPEFPILVENTYLASHSLGAVPRATEAALAEYYAEWATRGILAWEEGWWTTLTQFGDGIGRVLGVPGSTIAPMENVTRGFAAIASALDWTSPRNKIMLTDLEFLTSYPFWEGFAKMVGARIVLVRSDDDGVSVPVQKLIDAIDDETLVVCTSHVYFRSGAVQDLKALSTAAHRKGAYVIGDGYQSAGIIPTRVQDLGVDFYVGGSHKWLCGGSGAGYLYVREDLIAKLTPGFSGWFGIADPFAYEPATKFRPAKGIFRFLAGTPSVSALYAAREGIRTVGEVGIDAIRAHSLILTDALFTGADARGFRVRTPRSASERGGVVCMDFEGAKDATARLAKRRVMVDYRPNCGIRVSPHFYNSAEDIIRFFETVDVVRATSP